MPYKKVVAIHAFEGDIEEITVYYLTKEGKWESKKVRVPNNTSKVEITYRQGRWFENN